MLGLYSLAVLALTLFWLLRHRLHKHFFYNNLLLRKEGPPGQHGAHAPPRNVYPHLDPLFGLDLAVATWRDYHRGELAEGARRRHARHGPTFVAPSGYNHNNTTIHTIEPANIRAVTTHAFGAFGKAAWAAEAAKHVGNGVLLNEGAAWRRSRALLKPIFHHSGNRGVAALDEPALLEPHVRRLVDKMRVLSSAAAATGNKKGKGKPGEATATRSGVFDFHELASMFTLDVVTEFLFGKSTSCLAVDDPRLQDGPHDGVRFLALVKAFEGPSAEFIAVGPLAWLRLAPSYRRLTSVVDGMKAFFKHKLDDIILQETTTTPSQSQQQPQPQGWQSSPSVFRAMKAAGASDEQIQGEVQNLFFASYDTTSAFLANVMYVLVRHPRVQLRLRREISEVLGERPPTKQGLARLEYLRLFLMEGMSDPPPWPFGANATSFFHLFLFFFFFKGEGDCSPNLQMSILSSSFSFLAASGILAIYHAVGWLVRVDM